MLESILNTEDGVWNNNYVAGAVALSPVRKYSNIVVHEGAHGLATLAQGGSVEGFGINGSYLYPRGAYTTSVYEFTPTRASIITAAGPLASYALGLGLICYGIKKKNKTAVATGTAITAGSTAYNLYSLSTLYTGKVWGDLASIALFSGIGAGVLLGATLAVSIPILALGAYGLSKRVRDSTYKVKENIKNRLWNLKDRVHNRF